MTESAGPYYLYRPRWMTVLGWIYYATAVVQVSVPFLAEDFARDPLTLKIFTGVAGGLFWWLAARSLLAGGRFGRGVTGFLAGFSLFGLFFHLPARSRPIAKDFVSRAGMCPTCGQRRPKWRGLPLRHYLCKACACKVDVLDPPRGQQDLPPAWRH